MAEPASSNDWSTKRKLFILATGIATVANSSLSSSLPANAIPYIVNDFAIASSEHDPLLVTPISLFLAGYIFGPLLFAPLSESWGRRPPLFLGFLAYTGFTLGCCLAPNWRCLLIFRLMAGITGSAPVAIVPGIIADLFTDPITRGRAVATFMISVVVAPLVAPSLSGVLTEISWRWVFWIALIIAGTTWIPLVFVPETSKQRVQARCQAKSYGTDVDSTLQEGVQGIADHTTTSRGKSLSRGARTSLDWRNTLTVVMLRPLRMLVTEPIAALTCFYLAVIYAVFYMYFQVYSIIFKGIYGMSPGIAGLMFLPIGLGACFSQVVFYLFDCRFVHSQAAGKAWTRREGGRRLPLACAGGPLMALSMIWLGWTAKATIPWVVPFSSGFLFGLGDLLIFSALLNYLADSYGIFAASAMAASSSTRSIFGAVLPFASYPMYDSLGVEWATTLLGCLTLLLSCIPFIFLRYSATIYSKSKLCKVLQQELL